MLSRLFGIIYTLMNRGTMTAGELAQRFEVSVRTIYRDVEHLSMAGIPIYARQGKNGGISLTEQFILNKMLVSRQEQQQILAALTSLQETGAQDERETIKKLGDFFKTETYPWVSIDMSDWGGRRQELFRQIREAILGRNAVQFDYYGQNGEMTDRIICPVQLLFKEYTWYLRGYCRTRQAMRLFKVFRMKRVRVLPETFVLSEEIADETAKWSDSERDMKCQEAGQRGEIMESIQKAPEDYEDIIFVVDKKEAYRIYDRFDEEEITILANGDFQIHLFTRLDDWVYGILLTYGDSVKSLLPKKAKREMKRKVEQMRKIYC